MASITTVVVCAINRFLGISGESCVKSVPMKSDKEMYVQCSLTKRQGDSTLHRTIWGNADKAVVGNVVKIEEDDGSWTQGWTVAAVHGTPLPKSIVQHNSHAHTRQRASSDI